MEKHDSQRPDPIEPDSRITGKGPAPETPFASGSGRVTAQPPRGIPPEVEPLTMKEWWIRNGITVAILTILVLWLTQLKTENILAGVKVALGLSFVIFIHELGHFAVAKWCDVHVTAFSIGFGPVIPGCWFKWGETTYKLALFPLGGYVQMVGQVDGEEASDGSEDDPRSFRNKSVWARMAIISAGVIMNVILAIITFVIVFQGPGKDRDAPVISAVDTGAPAFKAGLRRGDEFVQIGDVKNPYFETLLVGVMTSDRDQKLDFVVKRSGQEGTTHYQIEPRMGKGDKRPVIGVTASSKPEIITRRFFDTPVLPHTPAARAEPAFEFGDLIVATTDPENPSAIKELPDDPRFPGKGQRDYFEFSRRMTLLAGKEVAIVVARGETAKETQQKIMVPPAFQATLGIQMQMGQITAVRDGAQPDVHAADASQSLEGDVIQRVEVIEPDKSVTVYEGKTLDPERLPLQLRQWADRLDKAKMEGARFVTMLVRRHRSSPGAQYEDKSLALKWDDSWRFDNAAPFGLSSPLAISELGIAYQIKTTVGAVTWNDKFQPGDVVKKITFTYLNAAGEEETATATPLESHQWAAISYGRLGTPTYLKRVTLQIERNKETLPIDVTPRPDETWPVAERGLLLMKDLRRQKASNMMEAIGLGLSDTRDNMMQVFQNIRGMIIGRISIENFGGPVTIARVAYKFAYMDFWEFVFFLGLISVNLAVINFLPIPVLDGGHMAFLIYEKLRGKPATEGIRIGATYAGLALILCLMVFVLYLDIFVHRAFW